MISIFMNLAAALTDPGIPGIKNIEEYKEILKKCKGDIKEVITFEDDADNKRFMIKTSAGEYLLTVLFINPKDEDAIAYILSKYEGSTVLTAEIPHICKGLYYKTSLKNNKSKKCIEVLQEYNGKPLIDIMADGTSKEVKMWIVQSFIGLSYILARRRFRPKINPYNMVYMNGMLKIIDVELLPQMNLGESKKQKKEQKKIPANFKEADLYYVPPEGLKAQTTYETSLDSRFHLYCWAMSFYQLISKKSILEMKSLMEKRRDSTEAEYNKFLEEIQANKELLEIDPKSNILQVIIGCLQYKPEDRIPINKAFQLLSDMLDEAYETAEIGVKMFNKIGESYDEYTQDFKTAFNLHEKALGIQISLTGEESVAVAVCYNFLASSLIGLNDVEKAFAILKKAEGIILRNGGHDHPELGMTYYHIWKLMFACDHLNMNNKTDYSQKAFDILKKNYGDENYFACKICFVAGMAVYQTGDNVEGLELCKKYVELAEKSLCDENLQTATFCLEVADYYNMLHKDDLMKEYTNKFLRIARKILNKDHLEYCSLYFLKYKYYYNKKKYELSLKYCEKTFDLVQKIYGKEHSWYAKYAKEASGIYIKMGLIDKALEQLETIKSMYVKYGDDNPLILTYKFCMGKCYDMLGMIAEASACYETVIQLFIKNPDLIVASTFLGVCEALCDLYLNNNASDKALEHIKGMEESENSIGITEERRAKYCTWYGRSFMGKGDNMKALEYFNNALEIHTKLFSKNSNEVAENLLNIGMVYFSMREHEKATEYYKKCIQTFDKVKNANLVKKANAYLNLMQIEYSKGNIPEVIQYIKGNRGLSKILLELEESHDTARFFLKLIEFSTSAGLINESRVYCHKALRIFNRESEKGNVFSVSAYLGLGNTYAMQRDFTKADEYYLKALEILDLRLDKDSPLKVDVYLIIADNYNEMGNADLHLYYSKKAYILAKKCPFGMEKNIALSCMHMGVVYENTLQIKDGIRFYVEALTVLRKLPRYDESETRIMIAVKRKLAILKN